MPWHQLLDHNEPEAKKDGVMIYVHQASKHSNRDTYSILVDVQSQEDAIRISDLFNDTRERATSMFELEYKPIRRDRFSRNERFREAAWYFLPFSLLRKAEYRSVNEEESGELYLRARLRIDWLANVSTFRAKENKTPRPKNLPPNFFKSLLCPIAHPQRDAALLTVVDCGHGNWNEIRTNGRLYLYDVGACKNFNTHQVRQLVSRRNMASQKNITVIISHWDVDHFHALLAFEPEEISNIDWVITPSNSSGTATYARVINKLQEHKVEVFSLPHASWDINERCRRSIELFPIASLGNITILRATAGSSSNQTGIVLAVTGEHQVALLTGDHHYDKVMRGYDRLGLNFNSCLMVAPHHGGHAGSFERLSMPFCNILIPFSCGANQWGHPYPETLSIIESIQGRPPLRTDTHGDLKFFI